MVIISLIISLFSIELDTQINGSGFGIWEWIFSNEPEGARAVLSTIAGSMMTVAGVTFSMTLISISFASSQIGPRVLSNFMSDRGNQVTLGTFISTFVFCLLVLRTVKGSSDSGENVAFVPHISILIAIIFAILSIAVLIYFMHHIPQSISMTEAVDKIGDQLRKSINRLYPKQIGDSQKKVKGINDILKDYSQENFIIAQGKGYIEYINSDFLFECCHRNDLIVEILKRPGDFVSQKIKIAKVYSKDKLDDELLVELRNALIWGVKRSYKQDILFPGELLVEIAARALSPGVNDPYTAIECLNQLQDGMIALMGKDIPSPYRYDENDYLRIIARPLDFREFYNEIFDSMRGYVKRDYLCTKWSLELFRTLAQIDDKKRYFKEIEEQSCALVQSFKNNTDDKKDIEQIVAVLDEIKKTGQ